MKNLKKLAAVGLTAAMTMAMSVCSFAATDVTFHFKNAANWSTVGAWIYEGIAFTTNVSPADKCQAYNTEKSRPIWPGAKMEAEAGYDGWYKVTASFEDTASGAVVIFNNYVADTTADTSSGGDDTDNAYLQSSGLIMDSSQKQQSPNQMIKKGGFASSEYWCDFDGNVAGSAGLLLEAAPASYVSTAPAAPAADATTATTAAGATTATTVAGATAAKTPAPATGDSTAYAFAFTGLAAVAVVVASKKKANN